jgi:hypothetical protein
MYQSELISFFKEPILLPRLGLLRVTVRAAAVYTP